MSRTRNFNPIRGTLWLPADVANLDDIDFEPLPEPGNKPAQALAVAPEMAEVAG
jgi:hypothetical protein